MLPSGVKKYGLATLEGTPVVLRALLGKYAPTDPVWDRRPDPERFTLREMIAHLADWDQIFLERMRRTLSEDDPTLPDQDEGRLAVERDYAAQDPVENLRRFSENRGALVSFLRGLGDSDYERPALRPELGPMPLQYQFLLVVVHDGYHARQAAEFTR